MSRVDELGEYIQLGERDTEVSLANEPANESDEWPGEWVSWMNPVNDSSQ